MESFLQDVRYALRGLRRSPGFAAAAIATLALGMGATTAIFSVIRAVVLAPLPYAEPERRVMIWSRWKSFPKTWLATGEIADYRRLVSSFERVAAWESDRANLTGDGEPVRIGIAAMTAGTFETLGAALRLGRDFTPEEDRDGGAARRHSRIRALAEPLRRGPRRPRAARSSSTAWRAASWASRPAASRCRPTSPSTRRSPRNSSFPPGSTPHPPTTAATVTTAPRS